MCSTIMSWFPDRCLSLRRQKSPNVWFFMMIVMCVRETGEVNEGGGGREGGRGGGMGRGELKMIFQNGALEECKLEDKTSDKIFLKSKKRKVKKRKV